MAQYIKIIAKFCFEIFLGKNIIGSTGTKLLIKSDLPSLKYLFLGKRIKDIE